MNTETQVPAGLLVKEAKQPLTINGMRAVDFIRRAFDLGTDLNGPGRYDHHDPVQSELRNIKGWIEMAEHDALQARKSAAAQEARAVAIETVQDVRGD